MSKLVLVASFGSTSVLNYAFGLGAGWLLGPTRFGLLAFAQSVILIAGLVLETGVPWSLSREVARAAPENRGALVRGAILANMALAGCLAALLASGYALGPLQAGLEDPSILVLVCAALPLIAVSTVCRGAAQGLERFWTVALIQVTEVAGKAVVGLVLVDAGQGVGGALIGFALGGAVAAILGLWLLRGTLALGAGEIGLQVPKLASAGPMFGALLGFALLLNVDLLVVKSVDVSDRAVAGYYQAAIMLANLPCYLTTSAIIPLFFARLARAGGVERSGAVMRQALRLVLVTVVPLELVLVILPNFVVGVLFPSSFVRAADVLPEIALSRTTLLVVAVLSAAFQASGRATVPARVLLTAASLELIGLVMSVREWGGMGAAITSLVAGAGACCVLIAVYVRATLRGPARLRFSRWGVPTISQST